MRAADALGAHVGELKLEAQNAAQNPRLVAALRGNADAATLQDLFRTEQWWEPYRNAFKVYAVAFEGDKLDVIVGMENADFASDLLIRESRERHEARGRDRHGQGVAVRRRRRAGRPAGQVGPGGPAAGPPDRRGRDPQAGRQGAGRGAAVRRHARRAGGRPRAGTRAASRRHRRREARPDLPAAGRQRRPSGPPRSAPSCPGCGSGRTAPARRAAHDADNAAVVTSAIVWSLAGILAIVTLAVGLRRRESVWLRTDGHRRRLAPASTPSAPAIPRAPSPPPGRGWASPAATRRGPTGGAVGHAATETYDTGGTQPRVGSGVRFGRYQLIDLLGEGGMAEVYTAVTFGAEGFRRAFVRQAAAGRAVARAGGRRAVHRRGESRLLARALEHHPRVRLRQGRRRVLHGAGVHRRARPGADHDALARAAASPGVARAIVLYVAAETLQALEYAHSKLGDGGRSMGIVHRDVSPSNILVSARGEVKLFDFGIVKAEGRVTQDPARRGQGQRELHVARAGARHGRRSAAPICSRWGWSSSTA